MKRRILKGILFTLGSLSTLLAPLASLPGVVKAQSCGWTSVVLGTFLAYTVTKPGPLFYYYRCYYYETAINYYYNGVFQYQVDPFAGERCTLV